MSALTEALDSDPDRMTGRARAYMIACAVQHLALGLICVRAASIAFDAPHFAVLQQILTWTGQPMKAWGVMFLLTGLTAAWASFAKNERVARYALITSSAITAFWASSFVIASFAGLPTAMLGAVLLTALAAKDVVISGDPMRSPFESILRTLPPRLRCPTPTPGAERAPGVP